MNLAKCCQIHVKKDPITKNVRYELINAWYHNTVFLTEDPDEFIEKIIEIYKIPIKPKTTIICEKCGNEIKLK